MNVLFLTLIDFDSIDERGIYQDLLRKFYKEGHSVYIVSPIERRKNGNTELLKTDKATILKLRIGNVQKTNIIEKGISTLLLEPQFIFGIKKYFSNVKFDLILYSTPPITFVNAIKYVKLRDDAKTYLLLKDIFPQNAVDIGMISKTGLTGILYKYFRKKEKTLYDISDRIGCMSQANVDYIINHNPNINPCIVEICPNSIEVLDKSIDVAVRNQIRVKYGIPLDKRVFIYGGNLGKPQGIKYLIDCMRKCQSINDAFFFIVGDGTEYAVLESYIKNERPDNVKLQNRLPKEDYDILVGACDIGLILLDYRFTIPNFPSRILSYMQAKLPVLAVTDYNTDVGKIIEEGNFGWWCGSDKVQNFVDTVTYICGRSFDTYTVLGLKGFEYLTTHYDSSFSYDVIMANLGV